MSTAGLKARCRHRPGGAGSGENQAPDAVPELPAPGLPLKRNKRNYLLSQISLVLRCRLQLKAPVTSFMNCETA